MNKNKNFFSFLAGGSVATLGGLVGLGGAEFRLPILVGFFGFATLNAIIFMIKYGISKKDILKEYSENDYNEALSKMAAK